MTAPASWLRCGRIEPGTAATASSMSSSSATRIEVSWRQVQRSVPRQPSAGREGPSAASRPPAPASAPAPASPGLAPAAVATGAGRSAGASSGAANASSMPSGR